MDRVALRKKNSHILSKGILPQNIANLAAYNPEVLCKPAGSTGTQLELYPRTLIKPVILQGAVCESVNIMYSATP